MPPETEIGEDFKRIEEQGTSEPYLICIGPCGSKYKKISGVRDVKCVWLLVHVNFIISLNFLNITKALYEKLNDTNRVIYHLSYEWNDFQSKKYHQLACKFIKHIDPADSVDSMKLKFALINLDGKLCLDEVY